MTLSELETVFYCGQQRLPQLRSPDFAALRRQVAGDPAICLLVARAGDGDPQSELTACGVPLPAVEECYRYPVVVPGRDGWPLTFLVDLFVRLLPKAVFAPDLDDLRSRHGERQARHAAARCGLKVKRSRQPIGPHQQGGLMLVDPATGTLIAGGRFELSPRDVITLCTTLVQTGRRGRRTR